MTGPGASRGSIAQLPQLLEQAREMLAMSDARDDPDGRALLGLIQTCVVEAHRLVLRKRIDDSAG